jgi:hypothetical protein
MRRGLSASAFASRDVRLKAASNRDVTALRSPVVDNSSSVEQRVNASHVRSAIHVSFGKRILSHVMSLCRDIAAFGERRLLTRRGKSRFNSIAFSRPVPPPTLWVDAGLKMIGRRVLHTRRLFICSGQNTDLLAVDPHSDFRLELNDWKRRRPYGGRPIKLRVKSPQISVSSDLAHVLYENADDFFRAFFNSIV